MVFIDVGILYEEYWLGVAQQIIDKEGHISHVHCAIVVDIT